LVFQARAPAAAAMRPGRAFAADPEDDGL